MQENIVEGKRQQRLNVDDVDRKLPSEPERGKCDGRLADTALINQRSQSKFALSFMH